VTVSIVTGGKNGWKIASNKGSGGSPEESEDGSLRNEHGQPMAAVYDRQHRLALLERIVDGNSRDDKTEPDQRARDDAVGHIARSHVPEQAGQHQGHHELRHKGEDHGADG